MGAISPTKLQKNTYLFASSIYAFKGEIFHLSLSNFNNIALDNDTTLLYSDYLLGTTRRIYPLNSRFYFRILFKTSLYVGYLNLSHVYQNTGQYNLVFNFNFYNYSIQKSVNFNIRKQICIL